MALVIWLVISTITAIYSYLLFDTQRREYLEGIDRKLLAGAMAARGIVGFGYHDRIHDDTSVSREDYLGIVDTFNRISLRTGYQYLWSNLFLEDGTIVFTSGTSTSKDVANGDHALFFDTHSDPEAFQPVMESKTITYSTFRNEWGQGRMVLVPDRDSRGRTFVFGASISVAELDERLADTAATSALVFLFMLGAGTILSLILAGAISRPLKILSAATQQIVAKNYGVTVEGVGGGEEFSSLADNVNAMSAAILSHHRKLEESERKYRSVIENIPYVTWTADSDVTITFISSKVESVLGFAPEEICGSSGWIKRVHPDDLEFVQGAVRSFFAGGPPFDVEYRYLTKDGRWIWIHDLAQTLYEQDGRQLCDGVFRDVTARKAAERELEDYRTHLQQLVAQRTEELAASEDRFRQLAENTPDWIWEIDRDGAFTYSNPRVYDLIGYEVSETIGTDRFSLMHPEAADQVRSAIAVGTAEGKAYRTLEVAFRHKDGRRVTLETNWVPIHDKDGTLSGFRGIDRDITGRKEAESQMRLLTNVMANSSEAILVTDADERIVFVNKAFTEITGFRSADAVGCTPRILASGHHDKEFYKSMWHDILATGRWQGEILNKRKNGDIFPEYMVINTIKDKHNNTSNYVSIFSDISRIKEQDKKIRKINTELEHFAYVTSHDLREPLRTISSFLGLIQRRIGDTLDATSREYFEFAISGADRMDRLIQEILAFSRIGRSSDKPTAVDTSLAMQAVTRQYRSLIEETRAQISVAEGLPSVLATDEDIHRLFGNFLGNALKYRDPGRTVRVEVDAQVDRRMVRFAFADNGIGIDKQFQNRVFRMFQRLHTQDDARYGGGTGVGLSICQKIVETYGGRIWVESERGKGSTFYFTLPVAD